MNRSRWIGVCLLFIGLLVAAGVPLVTAQQSEPLCPPGSLTACQVLNGLQKTIHGETSRFEVRNDSPVAANYVHEYFTDDGTYIWSVAMGLPVDGRGTYSLAEYAFLPDGFTGYVRVTSDQPFTLSRLSSIFPPPTATSVPTSTVVPSSAPIAPDGDTFLPLILRFVPPTPVPTDIPPQPTAPSGPAPTTTPAPPPPSFNNCQADPYAGQAPNYPVRISSLDKSGETVTLRNVATNTIDLTGWRICSITGNQVHATLGGTIAPGQSLVVASQASGPIWNNSSEDDGALYNANGQLISFWND